MDTNATELSIYAYPTLEDYYNNLNAFIILSIFSACILTILNFSIFFTSIAKFRTSLERRFFVPSVIICSLYSIISLSAFLTILLPKLWLCFHTVMHLSFTVGAILVHRLFIRFIDSEENYLKESDGALISIITPPCCCCCPCLPLITPSKLKFSLFRCMVWQMPFIQGAIMLILNAIYYTKPELFQDYSFYLMPFIILSVITGIWGLNIIGRIINSVHSDYDIRRKLFCLQLILLLCKLQYLVLYSQLDIVTLGGTYPMNHTIYKQVLINLLVLVEMTLVSILAQNAYKIPTQNSET